MSCLGLLKIHTTNVLPNVIHLSLSHGSITTASSSVVLSRELEFSDQRLIIDSF